jgi:hypothetical protein
MDRESVRGTERANARRESILNLDENVMRKNGR